MYMHVLLSLWAQQISTEYLLARKTNQQERDTSHNRSPGANMQELKKQEIEQSTAGEGT